MRTHFSVTQKAFAAVILANIIWSSASVIFKISLTNIQPFALAFIRFVIAALLMIPIVHKRKPLVFRKRSDLWKLIAYALTGITGNIVFYFLGLQRTYAINATILASGAPIFTLLLAHTYLGEEITRRRIAGLILGSIGLIVIIIEPLRQYGVDTHLAGNIFLVFAVAAAVLQTVIGRSVLSQYDIFVFTFWAFLIGAASFLPMALFEAYQHPDLLSILDWRGYMGIVFGGIFSSAVAYTCFAWGLSKISASDTSFVTYLDPIIGTVLGAVVLHEHISAPFVFGALMIFAGISIVEGRIAYHPVHKLKHIALTLPGHTDLPATTTEVIPIPRSRVKHVISSIYGNPKQD